MNDWISVNTQLPQMEETVILTDGKRPWIVGKFLGLTCNNPARWLWKNDRIMTVKYWMPKEGALPPTPNEEGEK